MAVVRAALLLSGWLLACVSSGAAAAVAVPIGDARIALDAPPGFSDTTAIASPRLQELAEALTTASNRILLFALADDDLRRFTQGDPPTLRRYMIAATPKGLEHERVTPELFATFVADSLRELGTAAPEGTDFRKYRESRPQGQPALLAELHREPERVSILQGAKL